LSSGVGGKRELSEILFNLASEDRLTLLCEVGVKKQRLRDLSVAIRATAQECSRHVARLADSGLVRKDSGGYYETTPVGSAVLALLPAYEFLLAHRRYFVSHDLSFLPKGFLERVGELSAGESVEHFSDVLELIKKVISTGREHVWLLSDRPMVVGPSIGPTFFSREIPVRLIGQNIDQKVMAETKSSLPHSELALLARVNVALAVNERLAGVCFPDTGGKIDFGCGFLGTDPKFRGWCSDLFELYWSRSRKL
jgi:predicted transcriptional regulator